MRCEQRTLDDIRALGGNDAADERRFATVARVSEMNLALYRTFMQPAVRAMCPPAVADAIHKTHSLRLQYSLFSDENPFMAPIAEWARQAREQRAPVAKDNPFVAFQEAMSKQIVAGLDAYRDMRDSFGEQLFLAIYGSPALQAAVGIDPATTAPMRKAGKSPLHRELLEKRISELKSRIPAGGIREAIVRAVLYVGMTREAVDERGFETVRRIRGAKKDFAPLPLAAFKQLVRDQYFVLLIDADAAIAALPSMLPPERETRLKALELIKQVLGARGELPDEGEERLRRIVRLFDEKSPRDLVVVPGGTGPRAKAS